MRNLVGLLLVAASLGAAPALATSYTVTFDRSSACATVCTNYNQLNDHFGSVPGVTISYRSLNGHGNSPVITNKMYYWDNDYGDLTDVAWAAGGDAYSVADITFKVNRPGATFTLNSFDIASWPHFDRSTSAALYDLDYNLLSGTGTFTAPGTGHLTIPCFGCTTTSGYVLQFGPSAYNVGIDNISFTIDGVAGVPEPAAWSMLIAGFGLVGATMRRRVRALAA